MLDATAQMELRRVLEELERLIARRLEERRATSTGNDGTPGGRLGELLQRPLAAARPDGGAALFAALPNKDRFAGSGPLARLVESYDLTAPEAFIVAAALAPEVDEKFSAYYDHLSDRPGARGLSGESARSLVLGNFAEGLVVGDILAPQSRLRADRIVDLESSEEGHLAGRLRLNPELAAWLLGRSMEEPEFSAEFPAQRLTTVHGLDDLIVPQPLRNRLDWVLERIKQSQRSKVLDAWGMGSAHDNARGYHVLLHGPPGTGKSMAAAVLGQAAGVPVYRIEMSSLISKYIGETQKNLSRIFERAEPRNWILFFDEADAIFGRRAEVQDARDRYANQEVSYLLQRLESYDGITIMASNMLRNIDEAFYRRIHSIIEFPRPGVAERMALWEAMAPKDLPRADDVDFDALAERYPMSGAEIRNVIFHAAYRAAANGQEVTPLLLTEGIRLEFEKSGRMLPVAGEAAP